MQKHTKIYCTFFGFDESDFIPCEICGRTATDIHHIDARGMGGSTTKDMIENLMALCRADHEFYGDKKEFKDKLKELHKLQMDLRLKNKFGPPDEPLKF